MAHYFHGLGKITFRASVVALSNCKKDRVQYVKLSNSGGGILAEKRGTAKGRC